MPYVSVFDPLLGNEARRIEVQRNDGAHPAADGYHQLTELVRPTWHRWTSATPKRHRSSERG